MDPHAASESLGFASVRELRAALDSGSLTSETLVRTLLDRIAAIDAPGTEVELRAILAVAPDVMSQAQRCDRERAGGVASGYLHGIPVVIKDNIEAVGLPCTAGSLALLEAPVRTDAPIVQRLRAVGAIVMASTNLSEWANMRSDASTSGWSAVGGLVANPWALDRSAGGSSSGSGAALAAGLAPLAIGTETDGSIVCPAALNGVVGMKPTVGLLPATQIVPISHSQDTPGPMARSVEDVRALWEALSGQSVEPVDSRAARLAAVPQWRSEHASTDALFASVIDRLRASDRFAEVLEQDVPEMTDDQHGDEYTVLLSELHDDMAAYLDLRQPSSGVRSLADLVAFNDANAEVELARFGQQHFGRAVARGGVDCDARKARERGSDWARRVCLDPALEQADVLLAPTYTPAWKHDFVLGHPRIGGAVTSPAAVAGYPILSLPMGRIAGLPVGLALVGRPRSEALLLAVAAAIEAELDLVSDGDWRPQFTPAGRG